jgi:hypothetical protein
VALPGWSNGPARPVLEAAHQARHRSRLLAPQLVDHVGHHTGMRCLATPSAIFRTVGMFFLSASHPLTRRQLVSFAHIIDITHVVPRFGLFSPELGSAWEALDWSSSAGVASIASASITTARSRTQSSSDIGLSDMT